MPEPEYQLQTGTSATIKSVEKLWGFRMGFKVPRG